MPNSRTDSEGTAKPFTADAPLPTLARPGDDALAAADRPRSILVTGGAGFIGSHLCEALVGQDDNVVCLDNFHTGRAVNVQSLLPSNKFRLVTHDVTCKLPADLPRFDEIYNLACPATPSHHHEHRVRAALVCAQGAMNMLDRAQLDGARLLQASTSELGGEPMFHLVRDDSASSVAAAGSRSSYDEGNRFAEALCNDFARENGLTVRIARIFNTYGPRMQHDDGRAVSSFIIQALRGQDITLYGDASQTHSFCYVSDLIDGLLRLMRAEADVSGPINVGNGANSTLAQLVQSIVTTTSSRSRIVRLPSPVDTPRPRRASIGRASDLPGWSPQVSLPAGLARTVEHFAEEMKHHRLAQDVAWLTAPGSAPPRIADRNRTDHLS